MMEDMTLRGFSARTQQSYVHSVAALAAHYRLSPDRISEQQLRQYFLWMTNEKHYARATVTIALCGIKFFFEKTLQRPFTVLKLARPKPQRTLPVVLSREEVGRILAAVRIPLYRACLTTLYACGLRLMEGATLQVADIDSQRMLVRVRGKGNKHRYVPLPQPTLSMLREFCKTHRSPTWLFPTATRHGMRYSIEHNAGAVTRSALQLAFRRALKQSGVRKAAHVHTLRHSYATHLLEANVNLRIIQHNLGHDSPKTTAVYTHLTQEVRDSVIEPLNRLMAAL
jgi:site-specific recombinase XerD